MRIGVMGGTFNPPHIGHANAASAARQELGLDLVLFVPASLPPHKAIPEGSASGTQRMEMTRLMARSIGAEVCGIEFERSGASYTADTLDILKEKYAGAQLWLIVGTDMFLSLQNWYQPERIFKAARIAVVAREASSEDVIAEHKIALEREFGAGIDLIDAEVLEISSTELRCGKEVCAEYLCSEVAEYIRENHLYEKVEVI